MKYYNANEVESLLSCGCAYAIRDLLTIEVSEDCIDRYTVLAELDPRSVEYKIIKDLPSVVPSRAEDEWIVYPLMDEGRVELECPICGDTFIRAVDYRPHLCENCGAKMKG